MSLEVDTSRINTLIERYSRSVGKPIAEVIRTQMRLFLQAAVRITPPKTARQGKDAIARDLVRAVEPITEDAFESESIRKIIRERDKAAFAAVLSNIRPEWELVDFDQSLHTGARNRRNRVTRQTRRSTLDVKQWKSYLKEVQSRVGRMKAAWLPALRAVGGTVPGWISRHASPSGHYQNDLSSSLVPSFTAVNRAVGIKQHVSIMRAALRGRVRAMTSDMNRRLRESARQSGFK